MGSPTHADSNACFVLHCVASNSLVSNSSRATLGMPRECREAFGETLKCLAERAEKNAFENCATARSSQSRKIEEFARKIWGSLGPRSVTVSTLDSESSNRGSNPREALDVFSIVFFNVRLGAMVRSHY